MNNRVGEIRNVPAFAKNRYGHGAWYVVTEDRGGQNLYGYRFTTQHDPNQSRDGLLDIFGCDEVPDNEVPDEVWAALARWRLTGEEIKL